MAALDREAIPDGIYERKNFADHLAAAERNPEDGSRFEEERLGYIEDVIAIAGDMRFEDNEDLSGSGEPRDGGDEDLSEVDQVPASFLPTPQGPAINPLRHVGRNDPCPCGSGKKAKRCCLRTQRHHDKSGALDALRKSVNAIRLASMALCDGKSGAGEGSRTLDPELGKDHE